jgi:hypothetical protein
MNETIQPPSDNKQNAFEDPVDTDLEYLWEDRDRSGAAYDIYLGRISRNPVVRSHATGKYFMMPWSQIMELAAQKGVSVK